MSQQPEHWEAYISKENFNQLRSNPHLASLLTLARVVNALRFCFRVLIDFSGDKSPAGQRQHINALLFSTSVLYGGLQLTDTLTKHFGSRASFQEGFAPLLAESRTENLRTKVLKPWRDKTVSHFDRDVASKTINSFNLDLPSYLFVTASGHKTGDLYYNLADEVAINFILGERTSKEEENQRFAEILKDTSDVLTRFVSAADALIVDVLGEMGWLVRERKLDHEEQ